MPANAGAFIASSLTALAGTSETLFEDTGYAGCQGVIIHNPNAANTQWVNPSGAAAAANGAGCFGIAPGGTLDIKHTGKITIIGTAAAKVTAYRY